MGVCQQSGFDRFTLIPETTCALPLGTANRMTQTEYIVNYKEPAVIREESTNRQDGLEAFLCHEQDDIPIRDYTVKGGRKTMDRTFQERTWKGWKKAARILAVNALLLAMTACAGKGPGAEETVAAVEETTAEPSTAAEEPVSDADAAGYLEEELAVVSQAVKVNLYEITDNNFIQGIDEQYDGKVLGELQKAVKSLTFAEDVPIPEDQTAKYHLIFINKDRNYLMDIMVGEDGQAWCGDGVFQPSEALDDWIAVRIKETEE